jgi:hypothetical protein
MSATDFHDDLLPQDIAEDDSSLEANIGQPVSEAEIDDILYGPERSPTERLALLRALRTDISSREASDFGENDPAIVRRSIDDRIAELEGDATRGARGQLDFDPLAHRETLSPDSDEIEDLEAQDENSLYVGDVDWAEEESEGRQPTKS